MKLLSFTLGQDYDSEFKQDETLASSSVNVMQQHCTTQSDNNSGSLAVVNSNRKSFSIDSLLFSKERSQKS